MALINRLESLDALLSHLISRRKCLKGDTLASGPICFVHHYCYPFATGQYEFVVGIIEISFFVPSGFFRGALIERLFRFGVAWDSGFVGEFPHFALRIDISVSKKENRYTYYNSTVLNLNR